MSAKILGRILYVTNVWITSLCACFFSNLLARQRHKQKGASQAQAGNTYGSRCSSLHAIAKLPVSPPPSFFALAKVTKPFLPPGVFFHSHEAALLLAVHLLNKNGLSSTACGEGLENTFKDWFMRAMPTKF